MNKAAFQFEILSRATKLVCAMYDLTPAQLESPSRDRTLSRARHIIWHLIRKHSGMSTTHIALAFNRKNHSSVPHGLKTLEKEMQQFAYVRHEIDKVERQMLAGIEAKAA